MVFAGPSAVQEGLGGRAHFQVAPALTLNLAHQRPVVQEEPSPREVPDLVAGADLAVVEVEADSEAVAAALVGAEDQVEVAEATAAFLAIAPIAGNRAFMATCHFSGTAMPPMPNRFR